MNLYFDQSGQLTAAHGTAIHLRQPGPTDTLVAVDDSLVTSDTLRNVLAGVKLINGTVTLADGVTPEPAAKQTTRNTQIAVLTVTYQAAQATGVLCPTSGITIGFTDSNLASMGQLQGLIAVAGSQLPGVSVIDVSGSSYRMTVAQATTLLAEYGLAVAVIKEAYLTAVGAL